jgi:hypothetical protein
MVDAFHDKRKCHKEKNIRQDYDNAPLQSVSLVYLPEPRENERGEKGCLHVLFHGGFPWPMTAVKSADAAFLSQKRRER